MSLLTNDRPETRTRHGLLLLEASKADQLRQFQHNLQSLEDEADRYKLCVSKRDELFREEGGVQIEFAFYELAFAESTTYQVCRQGDQEWRRFAKTAAKGHAKRDRYTAELESAAKQWGTDLVAFCAGGRGVGFAYHFARLARLHTDWNTMALPRLQQLSLRRLQLSTKGGRHAYSHSIDRIDLENALSWTSDGPFVKHLDPEQIALPFEALRAEQLPRGYCFNQYRLIVPRNDATEVGDKTVAADAQEIGVPDLGTQGPQTNGLGEGVQKGTNSAADLISAMTGQISPINTVDTTDPRLDAELNAQAERNCLNQDGCQAGAVTVAEATSSCGAVDSSKKAGDDRNMASNIPPRRSLRLLEKDISQRGEAGVLLTSSATLTKENMQGRGRQRGWGGKDASTQRSVYRALELGRLKTLANKLASSGSGGSPAPAAVNLTKTLTDNNTGTSPINSKRQRVVSTQQHEVKNSETKKHRATHRDSTEVANAIIKQGGEHEHDQDHGGSDRDSVFTDGAPGEVFLAQAIKEVGQRAQQQQQSRSRGVQTAKFLLPLLQYCKSPNMDESKGPLEVYVLSGHRAKELLGSATPDIPVISEHQQQFQWTDQTQGVIPEFFEWMEDLDRRVSVQIPSLDAEKSSHELRTLRQVRDRLLSGQPSDDPWNVLDCSCPIPATLPDFLTSRNCQLLARVRDRVLLAGADDAGFHSGGRITADREEWRAWRDVEHWALLSEGGHCTAPHTDSHGLATWITVQEGLVGFAWMSRPTDGQRRRWMQDLRVDSAELPLSHELQQWRYLVLKPGQTIFFPSGTIHAVFRTNQTRTLALGGHVLQWSGINRWADIIEMQIEHPDSTNEDMTDVWKWVPVIEALVQKRLAPLAP